MRNTCCAVMPKFEFTRWVMVTLGDFLRPFFVRSALTSVDSVSNCVFQVYPRTAQRNFADELRGFDRSSSASARMISSLIAE